MIEKGNAASVQKQTQTETPSSLMIRWEQIRSALQKEFGATAYKSWIAPVIPQSFGNGVLELGVPTRFMRDWVKTHYADRIRHLWVQSFGNIIRVDIVATSMPSAESGLWSVLTATKV
jgi:chromosomal replication initiator protein